MRRLIASAARTWHLREGVIYVKQAKSTGLGGGLHPSCPNGLFHSFLYTMRPSKKAAEPIHKVMVSGNPNPPAPVRTG